MTWPLILAVKQLVFAHLYNHGHNMDKANIVIVKIERYSHIRAFNLVLARFELVVF